VSTTAPMCRSHLTPGRMPDSTLVTDG
jgi:hypothetical protein